VQARLGGKVVSNTELDALDKLTKKGVPRKGSGVHLSLKKVLVDQHTRWLSMPARSPLQTGILENLVEYGKRVSAEVVGELGSYA